MPYLLFNFTLTAHIGICSHSRWRMSSPRMGIGYVPVSSHLLIKHWPYKIWKDQTQHTFHYSEPRLKTFNLTTRHAFPENCPRGCIDKLGFCLINLSLYLVIIFNLTWKFIQYLWTDLYSGNIAYHK